jgi:hypothetical protein
MKVCVFDVAGEPVRLLDCPDGLLAWDAIGGLAAGSQARVLDGSPWSDAGVLMRAVVGDGAVVWVRALPTLSEFDAATAA